MTSEDVKRAINALASFKERNSYSHAKIGRSLGVSSSTVSLFLSGKYTGDVDTLARKAIDLINQVEIKKRKPKHPEFVEISVARRIAALITNTQRNSQVEGKIGLIIGESGHGKSHCMRQFAQVHINAIYVELDDTMTSTGMFAEIARQLTQKRIKVDSYGSLSMVTARIIAAVHCLEAVIMIDEASGLSVRQLNQLRQVICVKCRCPLILAGNGDLLKTIHQDSSHRGRESIDQFNSRLAQVLNLDKEASGIEGDISGKGHRLYTAQDIRDLYEFGGIKLSEDAVGLLMSICRSSRTGRLRTCSHAINALHTASMVHRKGIITADMIVNVIRKLELPTDVLRLDIVVPEFVTVEDESKGTATKAG